MKQHHWPKFLVAILVIAGAVLLWDKLPSASGVGGETGQTDFEPAASVGIESGVVGRNSPGGPVEEEGRRVAVEEEAWEEAEEGEESLAPLPSGGFWGTVLLAHGKPAVNFDYWIDVDGGFYDRPTGKKKMFAEENPGLPALLEEVEEESEMVPLQGLGSTDKKGVFRVFSHFPAKGYLWVAGPEGVAEAFDLRGQAPGVELRLQRRAELRFECTELAPGDRWSLGVSPTWRSADGKLHAGQHLRRRKPLSGESLYVQVTSSWDSLEGNAIRKIPVLADVDYRVTARGKAFVFRADESLMRAPARRTLCVERRFPKLTYRIVDSKGRVVSKKPWILVRPVGEKSPKPAQQRLCEGEIATLDLRQGQSLIFAALFEDGEYIRKQVTLAADRQQQTITLVKGTGQQPWLLESRDLVPGVGRDAAAPMHSCFVISDKAQTGAHMQAWFDQPPGKGFGMVPAWNDALRLYFDAGMAPPTLLCLDRVGRAWRAEPNTATRKFTLTRLPDSPLESVDTKAIHHAHQGKFVLELQVEVPLGKQRRWVTLERKRLPIAKGPWPTWTKRVPLRWKARLAVHKQPRPLHLPLGHR